MNLLSTKPNFSSTSVPLGRKASILPRASLRSPHPQNVAGDFYVDHTCIDCDTCRWMAPSVFTRKDEQSVVSRQPQSSDARISALQALLSCPTSSIHTVKPPSEIKQVHDLFPLPIDENLQGIYHCGYHSKKSAGATSYFITRPDGNILVDSPKFTKMFAKKLEQMGGIRYMFLSHIDDVGDHQLWQQWFGCQRILHKHEVQEDTKDVEIQLEGDGPWNFLGEELDIVLTPGHTKGSICLFDKPNKVLFTGDHLFSDEKSQEVFISHKYFSYSVEKQVDTMRSLIPLDFHWVLPGHGRRIKFGNVDEKNAALEALIAREEKMRGKIKN